ncbi:MAG: hypothetical protein U1F15_07540 [Burkholderiales bacterium]
MRGRLNLFQSAMLRWREFHPYNAVHVAELPGALDADRLQRAICAHLSELGVARLSLDAPRRRYEYAGGEATYALPILDGGADPLPVIEREMERQLNAAFAPSGPFEAFRFFAVTAPGSFHVGVAYDHFVAGGDSIVALLEGIAARYDGYARTDVPPPDLYPPTYARLFRRNALAFYVGQYLLPGMLFRARRAFRPLYRYGEGWDNAFTSFELAPDLYAAVMRNAKAWGVTFNDLLTAMLLMALAPEVPERLTARRRREIAIACVINLRGEIAPSTERSFGQFLSSFMVSHPVPAGTTLEALARDVHAQTRRVKRRKLYLQTLFLIACGGFVWPFMTTAQRRQMYAKNYPVWAGVSTLNVEAMWRSAPGGARVLHYLRAISTGPFSPIVLAPASVGECLHVGVSYRTAAFRPDDIGRITGAIMECARSLA